MLYAVALIEHLTAGFAGWRRHIESLHTLLKSDHPLPLLLERLNSELSPVCRKKLLSNLIVHAWLASRDARRAFKKREGFFPPFTVSIAPTSRCNLKCNHCSASGQKSNDIDPGLLVRILREARDEMGVHFFILTGGEPFVYEQLLDIIGKFPGCYFQIFTNGTLLDGKTVERLAELGNALIMLSLEGFEEPTDTRRSNGIFRSTVDAMQRLHDAGIPYGYSVMTTRRNSDIVTGERFVQWALENGCLLGYYFNYMPVGSKPDISMLPTPAQRDRSRRNVYRWRNQKPIFLIDVLNDGPLTGGCTGAGRHYIHILSSGDVVPCVYCNFSTDNIKTKSLTEALKSPYLATFRKTIPFEGNTLRCCILLDRPRFFFRTLDIFHPTSCIPGEEASLRQLKDGLLDYAQRVKTIYDRAWQDGDWQSIVQSIKWSIDNS
jgi:MoaA/NifB/PqqE/SkfB family radical SAM enzyme